MKNMESKLIADPSIAEETSTLSEPNETVVLYGTDRSAAVFCQRDQLMAASIFFKKLFDSPLKVSKTEFHLQSISTNIVRLVVEFIKVKSVDLTVDNILGATVAAHYLTLPDLEAYCSDFTINNFHGADYLMLHSFAEENNLLLLAKRITQAVLENADEFFHSDALVSISSEKLAELIASDALVVEREENVWEAVWKWFLHSEGSRFRCLLNLVGYIRFPLMELHSLEKIKTLLSSSRHDLLSSHLGFIMEEAGKLVRSPYRSFTYSHPKYHLRDKDYQKFELAITGRLSFNPLTKVVRQLPPLFPADVDPLHPTQIPMGDYDIRAAPEYLENTSVGQLIARTCYTREGLQKRQFASYLLNNNEWVTLIDDDYITMNDCIGDVYHVPTSRCRNPRNYRYTTGVFYTNGEEEWHLIVEFRKEPRFYQEISHVIMPFHVPGGWPQVLAYGDHVFVFHCSNLQPNEPLKHRRTFRWTVGGTEWFELASAPRPRSRKYVHGDKGEFVEEVTVCVTRIDRFIFAERTAKRSMHDYFDVYDVNENSWSTIPGPVRSWASEGSGNCGLNSNKNAEAHETSWFFTLYKAKLILFETEVVDAENKLFQTKVYYHDGRDQWSYGEIVAGVQKASTCLPFSAA